MVMLQGGVAMENNSVLAPGGEWLALALVSGGVQPPVGLKISHCCDNAQMSEARRLRKRLDVAALPLPEQPLCADLAALFSSEPKRGHKSVLEAEHEVLTMDKEMGLQSARQKTPELTITLHGNLILFVL